MASRARVLVAVCLTLGALAVVPCAAQAFADVINVDTTTDNAFSHETFNCEEEAPGTCPLRAALELAQQTVANGGAEIRVVAPAGTYLINPEKGPLPLGNIHPGACPESTSKCPVTLEGAGAGKTIIDGQKLTGLIVTVAKGAPVTVTGVTLTHGSAASKFGGAISAEETAVTVRDSVLSENFAAQLGGAIETYRSPLLRVIRSSLTGNSSSTAGGIDAHVTPLEVIDSTVAFNHAVSGYGGGIALEQEPGIQATIINSTIAGNTAAVSGGAINGESTAGITLRESTIAGNSAGTAGGGIGGAKTLSIQHSILSGNTPDQCTNVATATGLEANIVFGTSSCGFEGSLPLLVDPQLGTLSANGGLGQTIPLLRGSPALNTGGAACPSSEFAGVRTDERGFGRPLGSGCDLGAFESAADARVTLTASPDPVVPGAGLAIKALAANVGADTLTGVTVTIPVPGDSTFLSTQPGCTAAFARTATVTCLIGTLLPGQSSAAVVTVRPERAGTLPETASVLADQADYNPANDTATNATSVVAPAVPTSALIARVLSVSAKGVVTLRVNCKAAAGAVCRDALAIYSAAGRLPASAARKPSKATLLAHGHVSVAAGRTVTLHLKLDRAGVKLARRHRSVAARVLLTLRPATGAAVSHAYSVTLRRAKKGR